jgi:hypothetical protein
MKRAFTWCCALLEAAWRFVTGPVTVEHPRLRLSLTKLLAIAFAAVDVFVIVQGKSVDGYSLALAIACIAAAFGKPTFQGFLARWTHASTMSDTRSSVTTHTVDEHVARTIAERRDADAGFEATP